MVTDPQSLLIGRISCHEHPVQEYSGVSSGSFVAPDHEYPSHLELRLTARDSGGLSDTTSMRLNPRIVTMTFRTSPTGLGLVFGSESGVAPFSHTAIVGSKNFVSAPTPQEFGRADLQVRLLVGW